MSSEMSSEFYPWLSLHLECLLLSSSIKFQFRPRSRNRSGKAHNLTTRPWQKYHFQSNTALKMQERGPGGFLEGQEDCVAVCDSVIYTLTNNIYPSASGGLGKLPEMLPFSSPVLPERLNCQAPHVSSVQVGTGLLIRGQISGTIDLQGGCGVWSGGEQKRSGGVAKQRTERGSKAHTNTLLPELNRREEMKLLADFAKRGGVQPRLCWKEKLPWSCKTDLCSSDFPRRSVVFVSWRLFFSSCDVIC